MKIREVFEIKFAEDQNITRCQLLKAGEYDHYGDTLEITADDLRNMKSNFDAKVKKIDLAIDYYHASYADAAGWIKDVILMNGDTELWIDVDWTDKGKEKILSKELRYLSADFDHDYKDNESGTRYGMTLNGGGLTNRPFVKGMNPIFSELEALIDKNPEKLDDIKNILSNSPKKGNDEMKFNELIAACATITLSDDEKRKLALTLGFSDNSEKLSEEVAALKVTIKTKEDENKKLSEDLAKKDNEIKFSEMLVKGQVVPAQKESFLSGDVVKFAELAATAKKVNLSEGGSGAGDEGDDDETPVETREQAEEKVAQLAEELRKKDDKLDTHTSIRKVLSENPELKKLINA